MRKYVFLVLVFALLLGCRKEPISWDVETLFPILHTQLNLQKAIPEENLGIINGNELQLQYQGNLIKLKLDSSLTIPDTSVADTFNIPIGSITLYPGQTFLEDSNFTRYDFGNSQLTRLNINSGFMEIEISSELEAPSVLEYSLPTMSKNGIPFLLTEKVPASVNGVATIIKKSFDLTGYEISLTGLNNDDYNVLASKYRAYIDSSSVPVIVTSGQEFIATNSLLQINPSYIRGSFGSETSDLKEENEPIDLFSNIIAGQIEIESSSMVFELENEMGAEITIKVNEIKGINSVNQTEVILKSPLSNSTINLNRATETNGIFSTPYPTTNTTILNSSNSNISEFISNLPNEIGYDFEVDLNPLGNVSNGNDFLYGNTGVAINLDASIPLNFKANGLTFIDTSDFSIDSTSQNETRKIIGGSMNIYTSNWFPFSLDLQFYMMDDNLNIIDSIFDYPQTIQAAQPVFGVVDIPMMSEFKAPVSPSKIENLYQTDRIQTFVRINTTDTGSVKVLDSYFIDTKIVGDFKYQIEIE